MPQPASHQPGLPLVSILTPVYNGAEFIEETVKSVLAQDYPRIEYIVLDDGSTDATPQILERFRGRLRIEAHTNMGETRTVNKGLTLVGGDIIAVVNADDPLRQGAVTKAVEALRRSPQALLAYPDWAEIDAGSKVLREIRLPEYDLHLMLTGFNVSMGPGAFVRRRAFELAGVRDTDLRYAGDIDLWLRMALVGSFVHVPEVLATHRVHPLAASVSERGRRIADEVVRVAEKCCDDPLLPASLVRSRPAILSAAHFAASFHAGRDLRARLTQLWTSFRLAPGTFLRRAASHSLYVVLVHTPEPVRRGVKALARSTGRPEE